MNKNGITTTKALGQEQYEKCKIIGKIYYQYDYRDVDGELFSTVGNTLELCRNRRDEWIKNKKSS